jgi:dihydroneopterin aldolase
MKQVIKLEGLKVSCIIGLLPHEREKEQDVFLDLELTGEWSKSFDSDKLQDTLDYDGLAKDLEEILHKQKFELLEKAAFQLAQHCLKQGSVTEVKLAIKKPEAISGAKYAIFQIELP